MVLTASLCASGSGNPRAQAPIATAPAARSSYPGESLLFDQLSRVYRYAADGTGSEEITGVIEIHNQAAVKALSVLPFPFASSAEHVEIDYIRVRHADGSVVSTPATDAQDLPAEVTREAPFYSDLKQEQIPIHGLREGDTLQYKVRIVRTKPEAPGHFWGSDSFILPSSGVVILSETPTRPSTPPTTTSATRTATGITFASFHSFCRWASPTSMRKTRPSHPLSSARRKWRWRTQS